ncbi:MAG: CBS domain-containing protein [Planctomycetales bacterium]|nr:CBS domain-containing protein [Planctomycetales bacterium]
MKSWTELQAKDVMTANVRSLSPEMSLREASQILADAQVSGAPVVGLGGVPVGVVSLFDIVSHLAGLERKVARGGRGFYGYGWPGNGEQAEAWARELGRAEDDVLEETKVSDLMTGDVIECAPETPLPALAREMWRRRIHRMLVRGGRRVLGIVSTMDLLGALVADEAGKSAPAPPARQAHARRARRRSPARAGAARAAR